MSKFRFDIGFLRVIAVVSVVLYHFKTPFFGGGYTGVDIFFVISGFLMTKIILTGFSNQTFAVLDFYNRRFQRLMPPLLIVCVGILLLSNIFYLTIEIQANSKNVLLSSVFVSNIYYWLHTDYFAPAAQSNIFLHSWSLAVEWQFYIIYPLMLLPLKRFYLEKEKLFKYLFVTVTVLLLVLCLFVTRKDSAFAFYMVPTRAWEMLVGGLAFLFNKNTKNIKGQFFIVCISYLSIVWGIVFLDDTERWPSIFTLIPTLSTFVIILLNVDFSFLKWKPFKFIGDISYEIYLWHWPIYVTFVYFDLIEGVYVFYMIIISTLVSSFSFFYLNKLKFLNTFKGVLILLIVVFATAYYCFKSSNNLINKALSVYSSEIKSMNVNVYKYFKEDRIEQFNSCGCFIADSKGYEVYDNKSCLNIDHNKKNIVLLGDSHAAELSLSFRDKISDKVNLLEVSVSGTFPFMEPRGRKESVELIRKYYSFIDKNYKSIDKVFVSVHWLMQTMPDMHYSNQEIKENILKMINYYDKRNIQIYFIGQTESYTKSFDKIIINKSFQPDININTYIDGKSTRMNSFLKSSIPKENYIDVYQIKGMKKYDTINAMPYMMDSNHFSKYGADQLVDYLLMEGYVF